MNYQEYIEIRAGIRLGKPCFHYHNINYQLNWACPFRYARGPGYPLQVLGPSATLHVLWAFLYYPSRGFIW